MLRIETASDYPQLNILLPAIDDFIKTATGKDWGLDNPIDPTAKIAATILLVNWFENPGAIGKADGVMHMLVTIVSQLQAKALGG